MPTTLTVACGCAFHPKLGEAGESLLVLTYCPTHAAAHKAIALLKSFVDGEMFPCRMCVAVAVEPEPRRGEKRIRCQFHTEARALLATLDQTGA